MNKLALGIDIGGTKIQFAWVDREGRIAAEESVPTGAARGPKEVLNEVMSGIERMIGQLSVSTDPVEISGIGIGSAGQIDFASGSVAFAVDTLPGWAGTQIRKSIAERYAYPVYVDNDVNVIALSEKMFGAGRQFRNFVCLALGTGLGGAIVADGTILRGSVGAAGELGHISVDFNGPHCSCGNYGCIEQYASGTGIARLARECIAAGDWRVDWEPSSRDVIAAWQKGDPHASKVMDIAFRALGSAVGGLIHTFNPQAVIVGGGVAEAGESFFTALREETGRRTSSFMWAGVQIIPALMGASSGVIGAAAQVWEYGT